MQAVVKMLFGSHLYGTDTEYSDRDYKGIFLPSWEDVVCQRVPKSVKSDTNPGGEKNSASDVDDEMYSLHYFLKLACEGQTVALDMLHAPAPMILSTSTIWSVLVRERHRFYTRNLKAFVGYARKQAAKYGIRGSRLDTLQRVIRFLRRCGYETRLERYWDRLPMYEHVHKVPEGGNQRFPLYQVCGKKFAPRVKVKYILEVLQHEYDRYGARAQAAKENKGIDWKAVSHAVRAAMQLIQIYTIGTIEFPLPGAPLLRSIKAGELDYTSGVAPMLEGMMETVESLAAGSDLPDKVDRAYWDQFLLDVYAGKGGADGSRVEVTDLGCGGQSQGGAAGA